jgi:hypothetical protein
MGFTPLCFLEIQIEPALKQGKTFAVPENQIFNGVTVDFK